MTRKSCAVGMRNAIPRNYLKWLDNCNVFIQYPGHAVRGEKGGLDETNERMVRFLDIIEPIIGAFNDDGEISFGENLSL